MLNFYKIRYDYLKFTGKDRLDLIHRLSTNDVNPLSKSGTEKTILTSDKGRFVDLLTLFNFGDFVFALCTFNNSRNVIRHLDKYTIMDDFKEENLSGTHESVLFFGDKADEQFKEVTGHPADLKSGSFLISEIEGRHLLVFRNDDNFGGYIYIYPSEHNKLMTGKIFDDNILSKYHTAEISESEYEIKRIENGIPKFGNEMNENTNPLECGLERYVSFTKGCYIGQEVIARLDTYDKISKHLVGVKFSKTVPFKPPGDVKITHDGSECGFMTSFAESEKFGHIGMGFVKTAFLDYDKEYKLKVDDLLIDCKITKLPFEN